ncbi:DoxX family protein [Mycobacterium sp. 1165196.3]|uniref:DoxX family protein n=1 Tax=unclassified Mycobacterium TaxID=2642494 RepID=UPI0007FBFFB8|nr:MULTISPECIES: DoxX family protein [unclassified Mycobacterium]OBK37417.1 DoxX family protein [Mycobacterium sp. 1165196.3]OBK95067.1 DoxX family protein [Mycobacterium sp. 1245499.0]
MNAALWSAQIVLAAIFALSGTVKLTFSRERLLATGQTGIAMFPMPVVRFTAASEILAAAGLVAPGLTGIALILTPLAAAGLCVVMVGAVWAHTRLHERRAVAVNIALLLLAAFVVLCRAATLH